MKYLSLPIIILAAVAVATPSFAQSAQLTATVRPNPLHIEVIAPSNVLVGEVFEIQVTVSNFGSERVRNTSASISSPKDLKVNGKRKGLGNIEPGKSKTALWRAKLASSGNFVIQADVSARLDKEKISSSDSTLVSATDSLLSFWLRFLFERTL